MKREKPSPEIMARMQASYIASPALTKNKKNKKKSIPADKTTRFYLAEPHTQRKHTIDRRKALVALMLTMGFVGGPTSWDMAWAWSHGQVQSSGPPPTPDYNTPGPGTNYYCDEVGGNDSLNGLTPATAWATQNQVITFGGYGSGAITINYKTGGTFVNPSGVSLGTPAGVASCLYQGFPSLTQPIIVAHFNGGSGAFQPGSNTSAYGLTFNGDTFSYGVSTTGSNIEISYCTIQDFVIPPSTPGLDIVINNSNVSIHNCLIGGLTPTSADSCGITVNVLGGISIKNNRILNCGGINGQATQTGFGMHIQGLGGTRTPWTFSGGVPTNALIEVAFNEIGFCGGNIQNSIGGGPSGIEVGSGDLAWVHDNTVHDIRPQGAFFGGTDFDPIDVADSGQVQCICERNFCYNCLGGLIDFAGSAPWGPVIVRYNLVVNCGIIFANNVLQDFGDGYEHNYFGNTFIQQGLGGPSTGYNIWFVQMNVALGIFANNIVYTLSPYRPFRCDGSVASTLKMANNCWTGSGTSSGFEYNGTVYGSGGSQAAAYAAAVANIPNFDATGITGDPMFVGTVGSLVPLDYELQSGSPCKAAGVDIAATYGVNAGSTYFNGAPVVSGAPNLGCMG